MRKWLLITLMAALALPTVSMTPARAASHMDAPMVTLDDAANTTDVYAFVTEQNGVKYLTAAVGVYLFEDPGIDPNTYNFDDNVRYQINVATERDVARGQSSFTYQFQFETEFTNTNTSSQSYLGVIDEVGDKNQNLVQTYRVRRLNRRTGEQVLLGTGIVPPNNQGSATPLYNQNDNGEMPTKDGVATAEDLDPYTRQSIAHLNDGHLAFAGQRDDGPGKDSQKGFNIHMIVLTIPVDTIGGDQQIAGVSATIHREKVTVLRHNPERDPARSDRFVQIGRQGNPLFNEGFVAIKDKDIDSRTMPHEDQARFRTHAEEPELAKLLNAIVLEPDIPGIETGRSDIASIYIPDVIKVDLSTGAAGRWRCGSPDQPR